MVTGIAADGTEWKIVILGRKTLEMEMLEHEYEENGSHLSGGFESRSSSCIDSLSASSGNTDGTYGSRNCDFRWMHVPQH
jgi:hypothetical protein